MPQTNVIQDELFAGDPTVYNSILANPHREPTHAYRTPLLTRHLSLLLKKEAPLLDSPEQHRTRALDRLFGDILRHLHAGRVPGIPPESVCGLVEIDAPEGQACVLGFRNVFNRDGNLGPAPATDDPNRHRDAYTQRQACGMRFDWFGVKVTIRFELHTEFLMITCALDFSSVEGKSNNNSNTLAESENVWTKAVSAIEDLNESIKRHRGSIIDSRHPSPELQKYRLITETIVFDVWRIFDETVLKPAIPASITLESIVGKVFADFRGIILSEAAENSTDSFQLPFWRSQNYIDGKRDDKSNLPRPFEVIKLEALRKQYWPLLTAPILGINRADYEFTVCGIHGDQKSGGLALYASAIGANTATEDRNVRFPVCYLMHIQRDVSSWQIGRMIDRIHRQGTLRAASVFGFDELLAAAQRLRAAEIEISTAQTLVHQEKVTSRDLALALKRIQSALHKADKACGEVWGPLQLRLARSRYYARKWRDGKARLRIVRMEGFQPYDEFVERRMDPSREFVRYLQERSQRILESRSALLRSYQSLQGRENGDKITKLQEGAEIALLLVLIPYYLGSVIGYAFHVHDNFFPWALAALFSWFLLTLRLWGHEDVTGTTGQEASHVRRRPKERLLTGRLMRYIAVFLVALALGGVLWSLTLEKPFASIDPLSSFSHVSNFSSIAPAA